MPFEIESVHLDEIKVIVPRTFPDQRGFFMESYRKDAFAALGIPYEFVQDNHSRSVRGVVRGLHFQWDRPLAKLMRVTIGSVFLVAVDIRKGSPTLGQWYGCEVSDENKRMIWAPPGFARGFCVLSDVAELQYKCTALYNPKGEGGIRWNDPAIGIEWPVEAPILSGKDADAPTLDEWLQTGAADVLAYDCDPLAAARFTL
ncbi:dTDP-4-dehydrorhamnose 3,5-epimerase [Aggregatilinea lenta]|uniref:dTDP-4-dehydrorhamnose 3,5-epimerase n=1 Tax=Aggregatilinea lenta TaxID=913108 RepID=UPI000E5B0107|nr:dTDP-4-dehydrorhamnose 3,5-epimerase [Aggregatilinea lenta]